MLNELFKLNRALVGSGFDQALQVIKKELPEMKIHRFNTGDDYGTWTIPYSWEVKDFYIKKDGKKLKDIQLVCGSLPIDKKVSLKELKKHLFYDPERMNAIPYVYKYYEKDWGLTTTGSNYVSLKEGEYEVLIDSELSYGTLKIGEYIIPGDEREILIMVHLDHPYQANDNLSGVDVAVRLAKGLKCKHTVRIVFVPETIGSIVYAYTQDLSKIEFGITLDMVGNDNTILMQQTFAEIEKINKAGTMAMSILSPQTYRKAPFRAPLGADEYVFNDPLVGVPTILFSRSPYKEYHSNLDTLDIIKEDKILETVEIVKKTIKIIESDWTPKREFKGPLMRSRYGVQQLSKEENRKYDYFFYLMDGNRTLLDLCYACQLNYDTMSKLLNKIKKNGFIKSV